MRITLRKDVVWLGSGLLVLCAIALVFYPAGRVHGATNISTTSTDHWAWNDMVGWIDFYNTGTTNIWVSSPQMVGDASSSAGTISLDCATHGLCSTSSYQVINDGNGFLSGWAWNDTYGWISFCGGQSTSNCPGTVSYEVYIDSNGNFNNYAWNDVIGWISFNCADQGICSTSTYKVATSWTATSTTSTLDSTTFDTQTASGSKIDAVMWHGNLPVDPNVKVEFQFAVGNTTSGAWTTNFVGPNGLTTSYFTGNPDASIAVDYNLFNNYRYFRYRVTLVSSKDQTLTPRVDDIVIIWSP
ncbi:MAG TPA: hypothetical protein VMC43_01845 [Candidatus Paceibacterota bacterium]|nr:hypothetical protein [Candidatus Paceibacterota bacterium]